MEEELESLTSRERGEVVLETALSYTSDQPVRVRVSKSDDRYSVDDDAEAVRLAGEPDGWRETAEGLMKAHGMSVDERGAVFIPAVVGRDLRALVLSLADTSLALYSALMATEAEVGFDSDTGVE